MLTPDFVFDKIIALLDSLVTWVGLTMHTTELHTKTLVRDNLADLLQLFLQHYLHGLLSTFLHRLWGLDVVCALHRKTMVQVFQCMAQTLSSPKPPEATKDHNNNDHYQLPHDFYISLSPDTYDHLVFSFQLLFSLGSMVTSHQEKLWQSLATILSKTRVTKALAPTTILGVLARCHHHVVADAIAMAIANTVAMAIVVVVASPSPLS